MKKEIQDLSWRGLPSAEREKIRKNYVDNDKVRESDDFCAAICDTYEDIFGHHNLTSDTVPPELLFVEREKVVKKCNEVTKDYAETGDKWCSGYIDALNDFFGDKCLLDKEPMKIDAADSLIAMAKDEMDINDKEPSIQREPRCKFKYDIDDKVLLKGSDKPMLIRQRVGFKDYDNGYQITTLDTRYPQWVKESELAPYTEPETKDNNNMEEKELNLCEILASGDLLESEFFSPAFGKVTLSEVLPDEREVVIMDVASGCEYSLNPYGCLMSSPHGFCVLFPSRALYEKYPLDAAQAWDEWAEERTPKRWRAEKGKEYFYFDDGGETYSATEEHSVADELRYSFLNYFKDERTAQQAAEAVRETLLKIHEKQSKQ